MAAFSRSIEKAVWKGNCCKIFKYNWFIHLSSEIREKPILIRYNILKRERALSFPLYPRLLHSNGSRCWLATCREVISRDVTRRLADSLSPCRAILFLPCRWSDAPYFSHISTSNYVQIRCRECRMWRRTIVLVRES